MNLWGLVRKPGICQHILFTRWNDAPLRVRRFIEFATAYMATTLKSRKAGT